MLSNFLYKQSVFTEQMEQYIHLFQNINWFSNCLKQLDDNSFYFDCIQENDILKVKEKINQYFNYKGNVCLRNFFIEGEFRQENFLMRATSINEGRKEIIKIIDAVNKRFLDKKKEIDFSKIENEFKNKYNIENGTLEIYRFFKDLLIETYFSSKYKSFPILFNRLFSIYHGGHVIIGWKGKFVSHNVNLDKSPINSIEKADGKVVLF